MPKINANIDELLESYDYNSDPVIKTYFVPIETELCAEIKSYGAGSTQYGQILSAHLKRTSVLARQFLVDYLGFSAKAGNNFYHANLLQDLGKIHPAYDEDIWDLPHRPTNEERAEKSLHPMRGNEMVDIALGDSPQKLAVHPHITCIKAIQRYHHEHIDGAGQFGKESDELGNAIKAICIIDAYDGDMIFRPHQANRRTPEEALDRMQRDDKYDGAFDKEILKRFIDFIRASQ